MVKVWKNRKIAFSKKGQLALVSLDNDKYEGV